MLVSLFLRVATLAALIGVLLIAVVAIREFQEMPYAPAGDQGMQRFPLDFWKNVPDDELKMSLVNDPTSVIDQQTIVKIRSSKSKDF